MAVRRKYIRGLAEDQLRHLGIEAPPVPVDDLAYALHAQVQYEATDDQLSGFLVRDRQNKRVVIGINDCHTRNRQRFTLAHEIGHLLLHEGDPIYVDQAEGSNEGFFKLRLTEPGIGSDDEEQEANLFAAELLMPATFLARDLAERQTPPGAHDDFLRLLAEGYEVSVQALTFRLANLGYVQL